MSISIFYIGSLSLHIGGVQTPYFFMPKFKKWRLMMMSGEVKTLKFAEDKPKDCKLCYYWGVRRKVAY